MAIPCVDDRHAPARDRVAARNGDYIEGGSGAAGRRRLVDIDRSAIA